MAKGLTGAERETVIVLNDEDGTMTISTHQRAMFTKLSSNPSAVMIEDISFGNQPGGIFELPKNLLTIRNGKGKATKKRNFAKGAAVNKCGFKKDDRTVCQAPARKDTGRCRWHS